MLDLFQTILLARKGPKEIGTANLFLVYQTIVNKSIVDIGNAACAQGGEKGVRRMGRKRATRHDE